jgi:hypothetical protein
MGAPFITRLRTDCWTAAWRAAHGSGARPTGPPSRPRLQSTADRQAHSGGHRMTMTGSCWCRITSRHVQVHSHMPLCASAMLRHKRAAAAAEQRRWASCFVGSTACRPPAMLVGMEPSATWPRHEIEDGQEDHQQRCRYAHDCVHYGMAMHQVGVVAPTQHGRCCSKAALP